MGDGSGHPAVTGDDVAAGVFDDQRVREPVGQAQRVLAGDDHVAAADDVHGGGGELVLQHFRVSWLVAREAADHDGEVEAEFGRGASTLLDRGEQSGQGRALAEAEDPVEPGATAHELDRPVAGALPAVEALVPPAEVPGGQGRGVDVYEVDVRGQGSGQRFHLVTQDRAAAVVAV